MSDLISRQALIEDIRKRSYINKALCEIFETIIDEQPPAYDVEKIVEELKENSQYCVPLGGQSFTGIKLEKAIDIVKRGGVE